MCPKVINWLTFSIFTYFWLFFLKDLCALRGLADVLRGIPRPQEGRPPHRLVMPAPFALAGESGFFLFDYITHPSGLRGREGKKKKKGLTTPQNTLLPSGLPQTPRDLPPKAEPPSVLVRMRVTNHFSREKILKLSAP